MKINTRLLAVSALVSFGVVAPAHAGIDPNAGFTSSSLPANDDGSTGLVALPFAANFFGTTYSSVYVNNNGNLTFLSPQSTYTPSGLGTGYTGQPIIAPFFADVDTRGVGSALTTYGSGTVSSGVDAGFSAFGATWNGVGYYPSASNKLDTFQSLLVNRSDTGTGNFDILFNYGSIQWETGNASGGSNGLGGTSAAVGINAGTGNAAGTYYQAPGSLVNGALINGGSNALNGTQIDFQVRNGGVTIVPVPGVPEPATWALMIVGFGAVGAAMRRRRGVTTRVAFAA